MSEISNRRGDYQRDPGDTFSSLGDNLTKAMSNDDRPLNENSGRADTVFQLTVQNLRSRAATLGMGSPDIEKVEARADEQYRKAISLCESPIECMVAAALINADWFGFLTCPPIVHHPRADKELPTGDIIIIPQFAFVRYRADFAVIGRRGDEQRIALVECDGEQYHNGGQDLPRDRYFNSWGIQTYRLKGSDIHRDVAKAILPAVYEFTDWAGAVSRAKKSAAA